MHPDQPKKEDKEVLQLLDLIATSLTLCENIIAEVYKYHLSDCSKISEPIEYSIDSSKFH